MADVDYKKITRDGLWTNNPATVQILGLCPLLAVTGTVVNALGLGLATLVVLMGSNAAVSMIRGYVTDAVRLPAFVMIIAALVTIIEMLMRAFTFELYEILGIFIPLIVTNCTVLGRADAFASKHPVLPSLVDGFMMGAGFLVILVILGALREVLGQGTLFDNMQLLFGPAAAGWRLEVIPDYPGFLLAVLPPGAFLGLGLIIAGKNVIDRRLKDARKARQAEAPKATRRVRTTGKV
ncbi:electron transport complex RsxE subunit [Alcanivorax sp. 521-1]|uniref:Ion-translocating oxidoreductase complex subunit E n=1 Tax=Alloalcanivorax profundimaris TaxID=2735259 RepID=A0ABS0ALT3_9GAMM|nr:electron transport complex subunit E [Alloalcanivorax profundimaris]MBF5055070.1 electron transport complex RsxE subunit [Alloalcanivorax profundimaris]MBM1144841.1 electron transport complex subunit E [Alcanivorax sp. ZXX171]MCQ6261898.1 electron transport complex subunit E [Alcanivorax sp. MM125-6]